MKSQTAFVRPQSRIELHAVSTIHLHLALVVFPCDAELDDALGDGGDLEGCLVVGLLLEEAAVFESGGEFCEMLCEQAAVLCESYWRLGWGESPL